MFEELVESTEKRRKSGKTLLASILAHVGVLALLSALPLIHYRQLPDTEFLGYLYAVPPPQPPSPPSPPPFVEDRTPVRSGGPVTVRRIFQVPLEIPKGIPDPPADLPALLDGHGTERGVPVGPPGVGQALFPGVEVAGLAAEPLPPPPPPPASKQPLRVGGDIQSAKLIRRVEPIYPLLALKARVQGSVLLHATIGETGRIVEIKVVKGHPLLRESAVDAVRQWIYSPTLLNGEPMAVVTEISVNFKLTR